MATFTFSRGNAQGLRRIPLYLLGALVTFAIPRTDRIWVFGSGIGPGEGALALLRLARRRLDSQVRLVWLATTERELTIARELGLDAVDKLSLRGYWLTARARVLVVTHGQGDVNRYGARGGFLVQLWHGIPLKRLHLDSPAALESSLLGSPRLGRAVITRGLRAVGRQISLFPVSSSGIADRIVSAFGVGPDKVVVLGDPRDDVLLQGDAAQRRERARASLAQALGPVAESSRVVMYAPTWREGDLDPAAPSEHEWTRIVGWLEEADALLIVRSHPLGHGDYASGPALSDRVRLLDATMIADLTPVLPGVDHLVTDYSSVAYDFALTGGSTVFLACDVATYTTTRGLYEPYDAFTGGQHVADWTAVIERLHALASGDPAACAACEHHRLRTVERYFDRPDGHATERVFEQILARTSGRRSATR